MFRVSIIWNQNVWGCLADLGPKDVEDVFDDADEDEDGNDDEDDDVVADDDDDDVADVDEIKSLSSTRDEGEEAADAEET